MEKETMSFAYKDLYKFNDIFLFVLSLVWLVLGGLFINSNIHKNFSISFSYISYTVSVLLPVTGHLFLVCFLLFQKKVNGFLVLLLMAITSSLSILLAVLIAISSFFNVFGSSLYIFATILLILDGFCYFLDFLIYKNFLRSVIK